jgi:hypothetical protein
MSAHRCIRVDHDPQLLSTAPLRPGPAVAERGAGSLDLFVLAHSNGPVTVRHLRAGAWSKPENLGGRFTTAPAAARLGRGVAVAAVTRAGHVRIRVQKGNHWSGWTDLGGQAHGPAALASPRAGQLTVLIRTAHGLLRVRHMAHGRWGTWRTAGTGLATAPAAAPVGAGRIAVVAGRKGGLAEAVLAGRSSIRSWTRLARAGSTVPALAPRNCPRSWRRSHAFSPPRSSTDSSHVSRLATCRWC